MNHIRTNLSYSRCPECGDATFPAQTLSPCGHLNTAEEVPFTDEGVVYSWTRTHESDEHVLLAMADFLGGALRVTAPVLAATSIAIGDRVRITRGDATPYALTAWVVSP
jgi:uncharacterized OB-fold protein